MNKYIGGNAMLETVECLLFIPILRYAWNMVDEEMIRQQGCWYGR